MAGLWNVVSAVAADGATNWRDILTPVLPAVVTAVALILQAALTSRRDSQARTKTDRRAEVLAAHQDALAALGKIEQPYKRLADHTIVEINHGTYVQPTDSPIGHQELAEYAAAEARVHLLCNWPSRVALMDYHLAVLAISSAATAEHPTVESIEKAQVDAVRAQMDYVREAKVELGISELPPLRRSVWYRALWRLGGAR